VDDFLAQVRAKEETMTSMIGAGMINMIQASFSPAEPADVAANRDEDAEMTEEMKDLMTCLSSSMERMENRLKKIEEQEQQRRLSNSPQRRQVHFAPDSLLQVSSSGNERAGLSGQGQPYNRQ
jgi:hypothetical protein